MQDRQSFDDVRQLPHVAGPRVIPQQLQGVASPAWFCLTCSLQKLLGEMLDQLENVVSPLAKRWDCQRNHLQSKEQIIAERDALHCALQVVIGRGGYPDVGS